MRWQRIAHAMQMLPEQEWPDVGMVLWQVLAGWPRARRTAALAWQALPEGWQGLRGRHEHRVCVCRIYFQGDSMMERASGGMLSRVTNQEMG